MLAVTCIGLGEFDPPLSGTTAKQDVLVARRDGAAVRQRLPHLPVSSTVSAESGEHHRANCHGVRTHRRHPQGPFCVPLYTVLIIIISCLYYSQVKPLNHTTGCHAGQQREVRHGPCVTRGSHNFTCQPHTDHSFCLYSQVARQPPFDRYQLTKLYWLVTEAHKCE